MGQVYTVMLPEQKLSFVAVIGDYLNPDNNKILPLLDYEIGGIALQDVSAGMQYQTWKLEYVSGHVFISSATTKRTILFSAPYITDISLAFDQNMNPFVAYTEADQAKFWWYDTTVEHMVVTNLPSGSQYPKCCLDDKRETQTAGSDIIVVYVRASALYFRAQRDRFLIEYQLATNIHARLEKIGMTDQNRIQFKMVPLAQ